MNPIRNPFAPGAGTPPPALAGRDELRDLVRIAVERTLEARPNKSILLIGLRGVGKTVLLDRMRADAEARGVCTVRIEAPESRSLPALLAPQLRQALIRLNRTEAVRAASVRGLRALAGFVRSMKVKYGDIEVGLDYDPEPGLADNGDLENDLPDLFEVIGTAAQESKTALVLFIDELQYVARDELSPLITAMHRCSQKRVPLLLVGAGLPQLPGRMGDAKSYAERLFDFRNVGALDEAAAYTAIAKPVNDSGEQIEDDAIAMIIEQSRGYPYFLQEWGKHVWETADASPIEISDVRVAQDLTIAALDDSFFRVRFDRLTPAERRYLRAMSDLGPGPHRSGDIADCLGRKVTSLGPIRNQLIAKGMIWSPSHGDTAFTVPLFDSFMKRIMPGESWR